MVVHARHSHCWIQHIIVENTATGQNVFNNGNASAAAASWNSWTANADFVKTPDEGLGEPGPVIKMEHKALTPVEITDFLKPGKTYRLKVLARSEQAGSPENANALFVWFATKSKKENEKFNLHFTSDAWRWYEGTFTAPEDMETAAFVFERGHSVLWVEGLAIYDTDPGPHKATLVLNPDVKHQTLDGFGFFGSKNVWWSGRNPDLYHDPEWVDALLVDLGLTLWRNNIEPTYPNPDSENGIPGTDNNWAVQQHAVKALSDRAKELGAPFRIILSVWSPPGQWKEPKTTKNGSKLLPEHYEDYAKWLVAALDMYKKIGADVYALSFQNEPAFVEFYDSSVYTAEEYAAMFNAVAPIVKAAYPDVLLFGAEGMLQSEVMGHPVSRFHEAMIRNETSMRYLDRFAVHGYSVDGVTPAELSSEKEVWEKHQKMTAPTGKTTWMSETSGYSPQWTPQYGAGRLAAATALQHGLSHGNLSGWIWWQGSELSRPGLPNLEGDNFINAGGRTRSFYAHKQFYRFIRPGSVRIESTVAGTEHDTDLLVSAWQNEALQNTVVTFVNTSKNAYSVALGGIAGLEYETFITSATEACESKGNVVDNVVIPPESVVTLVNGNYTEKK